MKVPQPTEEKATYREQDSNLHVQGTLILNRSQMTPAPCGSVFIGFEKFSDKGNLSVRGD